MNQMDKGRCKPTMLPAKATVGSKSAAMLLVPGAVAVAVAVGSGQSCMSEWPGSVAGGRGRGRLADTDSRPKVTPARCNRGHQFLCESSAVYIYRFPKLLEMQQSAAD